MEESSKKATDVAQTVLLAMDLQENILSRFTDPQVLLKPVNGSIAAARKAGIPIIFVKVQFRKGFPEISLNNKTFAMLKQHAANMPGYDGPVALHPDLHYQEGDIEVIKKRFSAFAGSDLEVILRGFGAQHLVLMGVSTGGVVLSTLREAGDKDYRLTVLSDCCADPDPEVHQVLIDKMFPRQADVIPSAEWIERIN